MREIEQQSNEGHRRKNCMIYTLFCILIALFLFLAISVWFKNEFVNNKKHLI